MSKYQNSIRIASRSSRLALIQVEEVMKNLPQVNYTTIKTDSMGDKDKQRSLLSGVPSDFFTREIDNILLAEEADIAVHSAKDLPYPLPEGLMVVALLPALDQSDALVTASGLPPEKLPAGSRIGTSSPLRKREMEAYYPHLKIVSVRGTIEERIAQTDNGLMDGVIVATCALIRLKLEHRIASVLPFKTNPLQGHLAVVAPSNRSDMVALFSPIDCRQNWGKVVVAGFGPGNPELLTVKAEKALIQADILFYDDLLDAAHLEKYLAEKVYVGKRSSNHAFSQDEINEKLRATATSGKNVVRIKGGDPLIFGRGIEEYHYLKSNLVDTSLIPGISSAQAAAAGSVIPLTARGVSSSVAFLSGHDLDKLVIPDADTLVFYMAAANQQHLALKLISAGRHYLTPVAVIQNASYPNQVVRHYTLDSLSKATEVLESPIIIIVGWTAARNNDQMPQKWLYTGTNVADCREEGLVVHAPLIQISGLNPSEQEKQIINEMGKFNRIIFTSRYSVEHFFNWLYGQGLDVRAIAHLSIDAIGKTTSEALKNKGLNVAPLSEDESSDGMIQYYRDKGISGEKILLPRSDKGLPILPEGLKNLGNSVTILTVYKNQKPKNIVVQNLTDFFGVVFSSPSTVSNFLEVYGEFPEHLQYRFRGANTQARFNELNQTR